MHDIQQLIDRYLAEGLSSDELARLSRAVHRDDAPAEWLIIREMIDTLTEGEDDYDLILAARQTAESVEASAPASATSAPTSAIPAPTSAISAPASAIPAPAAEAPANPFLRPAFFRELAAASVFLAAVIGAAIYFTRDLEPQIAELEKAYPTVADSPAVSPVPTTADSSAALVYAESSDSAPSSSASAPSSSPSAPSSSASGASAASSAASSASAGAPVPVASAAGASSSRVQPAARSSRQGAASSAAPQKAAAAKAAARHSETQSAEVSAEVPERRIYSCNLLDQIPENYEAPAHATDEY